ncbi:MAG: hypothetical protein M1828_006194 [Chrysothrix sp. TS-e1954]|nr:MAG: hypothetical protein M1828_006194 [Chrysothrix sp. TS-e1954]
MADANKQLSRGNDLCSTFRQYLPNLSDLRFTRARSQDAIAYAETFEHKRDPPWLFELTKVWQQLYEEPYKGITTDGTLRSNLFHAKDSEVEIDKVVKSINTALALLDEKQKIKLRYPIQAQEWRAWSNPEMLLRNYGLRLETLSESASSALLDVLKASLSEKGFKKAQAAMQINDFLGQLMDLRGVMNSRSYNFLLFGTPSNANGWGWSLYGHHLCLNVFFKGSQIVIAPTFTGAEPNLVDSGPLAGTEILQHEGNLGLQLMQSLPGDQRTQAETYKLLHDPAMLQTGDLRSDRWNKDDQRHLCGAFRDNRVVPYEGVRVSLMSTQQQDIVLAIAEEFLLYLPDKAREIRKATIREHFDETYFSWIGAFHDNDAFYYRIQSPIIIFEFDHHSGVFLTNKEPARFHIHTIARMPNGGDYGNAIRNHNEQL